MPTLNEGTLLYMPSTLPSLSVTKAARPAADPGQDPQDLSGSCLGVRQGRPRAHGDRPRTPRNGRDRHQPEAAVRVAPRHDHGEADRGDGPGDADPRRLQCLDDADQGAHRHAGHRHSHADRHQGVRQGPGRDREARARHRERGQERAGHHQRLCGARHRRLLPGHRARPVGARALWPVGGRAAGGDRHRARRRAGDHHRGGPGALRRGRALPARTAHGPAGDRDAGAGADHGRRHDPAGPAGAHPGDQGVAGHSHRERPAGGLHLRGHPRPGHRRLCRRRAEGGARAGQVPARLLRHLERPVRVHGAGQAEAGRRGAADAR